MNILVINAGSSSLKYQLIDATNYDVSAKGLVERIGMDNTLLVHTPKGKDSVEISVEPNKKHNVAIKAVLEALTSSQHGVIQDLSEISACGHRVVHGGEKFSGSVLLDDEVYKALEENVELAPLHNPANLMGIDACKENLPGVPMVCVFDTAFHQTMPKQAYLYALPMEAYKKFKVRRYGFHGTSHKYVAQRAAKLLGKDFSQVKLITCHLGNGSSIAAIKNGKVVDTTMGFTPLEGVPMGTRSGDMDAAIIPYLMDKYNLDVNGVMGILNKKSGVLGLSGVSSDFRDVRKAMNEGNEDAKAALEVFCYKVKKYIGSYAAALNGADAVVFTAGIGENDIVLRSDIMKDMDYMGAKIDAKKNDIRGVECDISTSDSTTKILLIPTNEELMIAQETYELLK